MKNKILSLLTLFFLPVLLSSCNDIIDKNIENVPMIVYNPQDSLVSDNYSVVFLWEKITGAAGYHIQVAQPNFNAIQKLVIDSVVTSDKFTISLFPGIYQWRIRAENGSSHTAYITRTLIIDSNSNLNGQTFIVSSPINNFVTNSTLVTFTWPQFPYATVYQHILSDSAGATLKTRLLHRTTLTDTLGEGVYQWKVRAIDSINTTATNYSAARCITIDLTPPSPPTLLLPANNSIDTNYIYFSWQHSADVVMDNVLIATDSSFTGVVVNTTLEGSTTFSPGSLLQGRYYYWRVVAIDAAGNRSLNSTTYKFYVQ